MKQFFSSLPADVKQTLSSLTISIALICGSLFMLAAYMDTIRADKKLDAPVIATLPEAESSETSD